MKQALRFEKMPTFTKQLLRRLSETDRGIGTREGTREKGKRKERKVIEEEMAERRKEMTDM